MPDFSYTDLLPAGPDTTEYRLLTSDGITVQQFNEPAGGQVVFHLHMHVMPRYDGVALLPPASRKEDGKVLQTNAAKLVAALKM